MVTKCFSKSFLLSLGCLIGSQSVSAMEISSEVQGRVGAAGLCLATNCAGYIAHELLRIRHIRHNSALPNALLWGTRAAWAAANLHFIPALFCREWPRTLIKRGGILAAACFGTNSFAKYVQNKLCPTITDEDNISNALKKGMIGGAWATAGLVNVAIVYESVRSLVNFLAAH